MSRRAGNERSRRSVLELGTGLASLAVAGSVAGCSSLLGSGPPPERLAAVPDGSEYAASVDLGSLRADDALHGALDDALATRESPAGVRSLDAAVSRIVPGTDLDPAGLAAGTVFGDVTDPSLGALGDASVGLGAVLWTDWDPGSFVGALETETGRNFDRGRYEETPVYVPDGRFGDLVAVADLGDGVYAVGLRAAVEGAIDASDGRADPVTGPVLDGFEASDEGYLRVGTAIPRERLADRVPGPIQPSVIEDLEYGFGSIGRDGDRRTIDVGVSVATANSAGDLADAFEGYRLLYAERYGRPDSGPDARRIRALLQDARVVRQGRTVSLRYAGDPATVGAAVGSLAFGPFGLPDPVSVALLDR